MSHTILAPTLALALFIAMLVLLEAGRRMGRRRMALDPGAPAVDGAIEGAAFALLGLMIAFTFSGAASRFDERRQLILRESNAIGTAWLRLDVLPADGAAPLRDAFRRYLDARIEAYRKLPDVEAALAGIARAEGIQGAIWAGAVQASKRPDSGPAMMLLLPALNEMFDIAAARTAARNLHPPAIIFVMLFVFALVSSYMAGHGLAAVKRPSMTFMSGFAALTAVAVYVILDLEYPRLGLIQVDAFDELLVALRRSMG